MSTLTQPTLRDGRTLLDTAMFDRLVRRIAAEHPELAPDMPARIMDQALAFLGATATTTQPIGPSELVDIGWHTFILYTVDYARFCDDVAGRFIHHVPNEDETAIPRGEAGMLQIADCETGNCKCTKPPTAEQCRNAAGEPITQEPVRGGLKVTVRAIHGAGFRVDRDLWPAAATADCTQCHAGCHDSPGRK
ncbi:glycine-rich domain-containing protein [Actinoplanes siamensis]|uniref:Uncharacterized protein n=1 Tax=Actinoplanes siamensis TaxID=1223317 RepID=A0A919TPI7_9ACTN|nr:hypothetical protein [Actinoplanes siamensis]GIF09939.1 hypothetical protein Asi03nite_74770 [Actinoplanes siamensis]